MPARSTSQLTLPQGWGFFMVSRSPTRISMGIAIRLPSDFALQKNAFVSCSMGRTRAGRETRPLRGWKMRGNADGRVPSLRFFLRRLGKRGRQSAVPTAFPTEIGETRTAECRPYFFLPRLGKRGRQSAVPTFSCGFFLAGAAFRPQDDSLILSQYALQLCSNLLSPAS